MTVARIDACLPRAELPQRAGSRGCTRQRAVKLIAMSRCAGFGVPDATQAHEQPVADRLLTTQFYGVHLNE